MPKLLTGDQVRHYREDGFVAPVRVLTSAQAGNFRRRFEAYERAHAGWYELSKGQKLYLLQTWVAELACDTKVLDAVEDVLGPNIFVWGVSLFVKDAQSPSYVSWHQDSTYWGLSEPDVVTAWVALSAATRESGCMKMIPGSHKHEQTKAKRLTSCCNLGKSRCITSARSMLLSPITATSDASVSPFATLPRTCASSMPSTTARGWCVARTATVILSMRRRRRPTWILPPWRNTRVS
jgi:hypothetical protein